MAHRHPHGGMMMLDALAAHSGLRSVSPVIKTAFSIATLTLCVSASDAVVGIVVAASMVLVMHLLGKVSLEKILTLLRIPMLFLIVSCVVILLEVSPDPMGFWQVPLGSRFVCMTAVSLRSALTLFFQAMGAVSCLYFLSSSTPMPQLIEVLRRFHVPELVIELMYLIYRYLFVLLDVQQTLTISASARLGYNDLRRSVSTAGRISGTLLASSFRRSSQCFDAMESRGYDGKLAFLSHMPSFRWRHFFAAAAYLLGLLILILIRKGWLQL